MKWSCLREKLNVKRVILGFIIGAATYIGWVIYIPYTMIMRSDLSHHLSINESIRMPLNIDKQEITVENGDIVNIQLQKVRVLCWVMTFPGNLDTKAISVNNTWGKRCNKLLFMSSSNDSLLPTLDLGYHQESRDILWGKTKKAFKYVYDNFLNDYDWFMKADDDTYVVIENLIYLLSAYDADNDAIYFGSRFKKFTKQGYMSGGGGYTLSRKSLKLFVEKALTNKSICKQDDSGSEDAEMGICLNNVGVMAGDSRDSHAQGRFFPFEPQKHLVPGEIDSKMWYWDYIYYPIKNGPECCSDLAISFHYIPPKKMYELEYFIYHLHPFGFHHTDPFPALLPPDKKSIPERILKMHPGLAERSNKTENVTDKQ